jgi:hypothetical protein
VRRSGCDERQRAKLEEVGKVESRTWRGGELVDGWVGVGVVSAWCVCVCVCVCVCARARVAEEAWKQDTDDEDEDGDSRMRWLRRKGVNCYQQDSGDTMTRVLLCQQLRDRARPSAP